MARTLHADLESAQRLGYPTGGVQPALNLVFTRGATTYDYSFNPTLNTNRPTQLEHHEQTWDDYATIILRNNDLAVPDLRGYYVDIGYGAQTASGLRYSAAPRLWVKEQYEVSMTGGAYGLRVVLTLGGKMRILREQKMQLGYAPTFRAEGGQLTGLTIYGILNLFLGAGGTLAVETGYAFTLDALGSQDDGFINTFVPQPTNIDSNGDLLGFRPQVGDTYATFFERLMRNTKCKLMAGSGLTYKIVYPQVTDAVNERYYSASADGHPFTDYQESKFLLIPNWIAVYGGYRGTTSNMETYDYIGNAYDPESWSPAHDYNGSYMRVRHYFSDKNEGGYISSQPNAQKIAEARLDQARENTFGGRAVIPHDCGIELYDNAVFINTRGV